MLLTCCVVGAVIGGFAYFTSSDGIAGLVATVQVNPVVIATVVIIPPNPPAETLPPVITEIVAAQPTPTVTPTLEPTPNANANGIGFTFAPGVAQNVNAETVPAAVVDQPSGIPGEVYPQHTKFTFNGYPLSGTFHSPYILVYPAKEYADINPSAVSEINELKQFLLEKPTTAEKIPFMPFWMAAQMFHSNVAFISFKGGSGVRFLTMYGQAYYPVNNNSMFYTFQGLTDDGAYYIAAVLPVSHPSLPATENDVPGGDFDAFVANIETYWAETAANLEAQPLNSFTPDLSLLDAMFASFTITP